MAAMALALGASVAAIPSVRAEMAVRGLPFSRSYPLEEIGNVSRGARLSFDGFGRLTVTEEGVYAVLNDTAWVNLADQASQGTHGMSNVVRAADGHAYYGGRGSFGRTGTNSEGRLYPISLVPANAPAWTNKTSFDHIVAETHGVYFAGWNGIAYWSFARRSVQFFELSGIAEIFRVGERAFVSAHGHPLDEIDVTHGTLRPVPGADFGAVDVAAVLDETRTLISVAGGKLLVFDGEQSFPWPGQSRNGITGTVSALHRLADGGTAVAITGKGLFLVSPEGELISALTTPEYHRITSLATREPGVLWVMAENSIEKVMYGGPLTVFGQRLGLPLSWPTIVRWKDRIIASTGGRWYEAVAGTPGSPTHFEAMANMPAAGAWGIAAAGSQILAGNVTGIFSLEPDGRFARVLSADGIVHLTTIGDDVCFALGQPQILALQWSNGRWAECAPRIPGIGFPAVVHASKRSAWIELGGNKVARLSLKDGRLNLRVFDHLPMPDTPWVNVGIVDDTVVLSGSSKGRVFFDERTETFCKAPQLQRLLDESPYWITRVQKDETGTLWASHRQGVVTYTPANDGGYTMDSSTYDLINDLYPSVEVLPGNDIWIASGRSLYHVERWHERQDADSVQPVLVSVVDSRTNTELLEQGSSKGPALRLPFERNSLRLRFFSGSYAWRRTPVYEFRLNGADSWATLGAGSPLSFSELHEGRYHLEMRIAGTGQDAASSAAFNFEILPPWHRTWPAYLAYCSGALLAVLGLVHYSGARSRHRHMALEKLVHERTSQLETTMDKLNEETRIAATLAERNRLAGEIHDSLQQGLSGAILQLDATLRLPTVEGRVRSRLEVVRNMVSFTRHEVQHAVWDMESPLLEDTELGEALRKLTSLINSGVAAVEVAVSGPPIPLPSAVKHHLLRIAQEGTTNAVRHAQAKRIAIQVDYQPTSVELTVVDDGIGFQPDEVLAKSVGHFGLRGLRGRTRKMGGQLQIQSSAGQGTSIRVFVPLAGEPPAPHAKTREA